MVADAGALYLTPDDAEYPERLREIYDPPAVLWVRGNAELLSRPGIAVVGTRAPSPYGAGMAGACLRAILRTGAWRCSRVWRAGWIPLHTRGRSTPRA